MKVAHLSKLVHLFHLPLNYSKTPTWVYHEPISAFVSEARASASLKACMLEPVDFPRKDHLFTPLRIWLALK